MNIKQKLVFSFFTLVLLVFLMAGVSFWLGTQGSKNLKAAIRDYSTLVCVREIGSAIDGQNKSFNYYLVLGDQEELNKFDEFNHTVRRYFSEWYPLINSVEEKKRITHQEKLFEEVNVNAGNVVRLYQSGKKDVAMSTAEKVMFTGIDKLRADFKSLVIEKQNAVSYSQNRVVRIGKLSTILSVGVSGFSLFLGLLMSLLIFRSIAVPLVALQEGAKRIGEGKLDYKVVNNSKDEIGQVARSFNLMAENLRSMQTQIIQMDRMSSLGQLAGGVAHELNNPLTGVLGQCQLLLEKIPATEINVRASLEKIERAAQRCRRIVRALLDFARQKDYVFLETDLSQLIDETLDFSLSDLTSAKVSIRKLDPPVDLPKVKLSSSHMQQVFLNLITNAIQAMPQGGLLTISMDKKDEITESGTSQPVVYIYFKDEGTGIKKEHISHVFDPFFTTKDIGKGTGLGLTISYGIVQRHRGKIIAQSEGEGKGATLTVVLPIE